MHSFVRLLGTAFALVGASCGGRPVASPSEPVVEPAEPVAEPAEPVAEPADPPRCVEQAPRLAVDGVVIAPLEVDSKASRDLSPLGESWRPTVLLSQQRASASENSVAVSVSLGYSRWYSSPTPRFGDLPFPVVLDPANLEAAWDLTIHLGDARDPYQRNAWDRNLAAHGHLILDRPQSASDEAPLLVDLCLMATLVDASPARSVEISIERVVVWLDI